jgi:hypothetical protein
MPEEKTIIYYNFTNFAFQYFFLNKEYVIESDKTI